MSASFTGDLSSLMNIGDTLPHSQLSGLVHRREKAEDLYDALDEALTPGMVNGAVGDAAGYSQSLLGICQAHGHAPSLSTSMSSQVAPNGFDPLRTQAGSTYLRPSGQYAPYFLPRPPQQQRHQAGQTMQQDEPHDMSRSYAGHAEASATYTHPGHEGGQQYGQEYLGQTSSVPPRSQWPQQHRTSSTTVSSTLPAVTTGGHQEVVSQISCLALHKLPRPLYSSHCVASKKSYAPVQVYSFVPISGLQQEPKRKRRRFEEIERMYVCGWNGCEKAYGTLNHLNGHVTMQSHGQKRTPNGM